MHRGSQVPLYYHLRVTSEMINCYLSYIVGLVQVRCRCKHVKTQTCVKVNYSHVLPG